MFVAYSVPLRDSNLIVRSVARFLSALAMYLAATAGDDPIEQLHQVGQGGAGIGATARRRLAQTVRRALRQARRVALLAEPVAETGGRERPAP